MFWMRAGHGVPEPEPGPTMFPPLGVVRLRRRARRPAVRRQGHGTMAKSLGLRQARLTIWRLTTVTGGEAF